MAVTIDGAISWNAQIAAQTAAATAATTNQTLSSGSAGGTLVSNGSSLTHTLPAASSVRKGSRLQVKNLHASAATFSPAGSDKIDGQTSSVTVSTNVVKSFVSDGVSNWYSWTD